MNGAEFALRISPIPDSVVKGNLIPMHCTLSIHPSSNICTKGADEQVMDPRCLLIYVSGGTVLVLSPTKGFCRNNVVNLVLTIMQQQEQDSPAKIYNPCSEMENDITDISAEKKVIKRRTRQQ